MAKIGLPHNRRGLTTSKGATGEVGGVRSSVEGGGSGVGQRYKNNRRETTRAPRSPYVRKGSSRSGRIEPEQTDPEEEERKKRGSW